jgi:hypothetical protein
MVEQDAVQLCWEAWIRWRQIVSGYTNEAKQHKNNNNVKTKDQRWRVISTKATRLPQKATAARNATKTTRQALPSIQTTARMQQCDNEITTQQVALEIRTEK